MAEWIFDLSLVLIIYTYAGYPLLLFVFSLFMNREINRGNILPEVSIIIPVHNEERLIREKINNCLEFDYPREKLKIMVASDSSSDKTEEVVKGFESERIIFLSLPFRGGKVAAQNYAVQFCDSEIIILTDVGILTDADSVNLIVENFHDKGIGVVSCRDAIVEGKEHPRGEKSYIRYDMMVRKYTSRIGSIIGVTGGFYAVRKEVAKGGWNPAFPPDFYVAIRSIKRGLRVIEDPRVKAYYRTAAKEWDELQRKVRTINRGMHALFGISNRNLFNPLKYGLVSFGLLSHKLFRWMTPFVLISLLLSSLMLLDKSVIAGFLFLFQLGIYLLAAITFLGKKEADQKTVFKLASYFAIANIAILKAWYEFIIGKKYVMWEPTKR